MTEIKPIACEEALTRLFDYLDKQLDDNQRQEMEHHMSVCRSCYSRVEFETRLQHNLRATGEEPVPERLQQRVHRLIKQY